MFGYCESLTSIDIDKSKFKTTEATNFSGMFLGCKNKRF